MLECVVNVSEGRTASVLDDLVRACGDDLLDLHVDPHHHRSVFTLVGESAPRRLAEQAWRHLDLSEHSGVHPRLGVVDVVPFVPLVGSTSADALRARDEFARWAGDNHGITVFVYGPERSLPEVRAAAPSSIAPDAGPSVPNPRTGAVCVGARGPLVAWNLWLDGTDLPTARRVASAIRGPHLRALGLDVGGRTQVSCNLVSPEVLGPHDAYRLVSDRAAVTGAELVGLIEACALAHVPRPLWDTLDLDVSRTVESRLARRALTIAARQGAIQKGAARISR